MPSAPTNSDDSSRTEHLTPAISETHEEHQKEAHQQSNADHRNEGLWLGHFFQPASYLHPEDSGDGCQRKKERHEHVQSM